MDKQSVEEKIDEIHTAVIQMKSDLAADRKICGITHSSVNGRIEGIHRKLVGNGQPGLEQNLQTLTARFDKFETKFIAYATAAILVVQVVAPHIAKALGWG